MSLNPGHGDLAEKHDNAVPAYESATLGDDKGHNPYNGDPENMVEVKQNLLHKDLKGRHMQMIAMQV
jgi:amino acid permease